MKVDGTIDKFKVRLVAKYFTQKQKISYLGTYALVARIVVIRMLIEFESIYNPVITEWM